MKISRSIAAKAALQAALVVGLCAANAQAQRLPPPPPNDVTCFHRPTSVPGLSGLPLWPAVDNAQANSDGDPMNLPADSSLREKSQLAEPRWGNAPLIPPLYAAGDRSRFRILTQTTAGKTQLAVSIQVVDDANGLIGDEYVMFGVATNDRKHAWSVRYTPFKTGTGSNALEGKNITIVGSTYARAYYYDASLLPAEPWRALSAAERDALFTNAAYWNPGGNATEEALSGAKWGVQFKFNVPTDFGVETGGFFVTTHTGMGSDGSTLSHDSATRDIFTGCGSVACEMYPASLSAALPKNPADWGNIDQILSGACKGVSVDSIASTNSASANKVNVDPSDENIFEIGLTTSGTDPIAPNTVAADLFIANWGSVVTTQGNAVYAAGTWTPLTTLASPPTNDTVAGKVTFNCFNDPGAATNLNICGKVPSSNIAGRTNLHQCMQAQLHQSSASTPIQFDVASAYRNMFYEHTSETSQLAEISVKGLQALLKNSNARTVYLHVVQRNLPLAGQSVMTLNTKALDALRAEVDPTFQSADLTCADARDRCYTLPQGLGDHCARPASIGEGEGEFGGPYYYCSNETDTIDLGARGTVCVFNPNDVCTPPAGGGLDRTVSALTPEQRVRAQWPNYEVYPYYDTGKVVTNDGKQSKQLVPMPSFGIYVSHEGPFYGFLSSLVEETGSLTSPTNKILTQITPDLFKLSIPNEGTARLRLKIASADRAPDPFFEITGTVTPLGATLGNATITGVARTRTLDLSKASVSIQTLLESGGKELVTNKVGSITLTRQAGALPGLATFAKTSGTPIVTMQAARLPLIGLTVAMQVSRASISVPASCPFSFGTATIKTQFTINDGSGSPVILFGSDTWACFPGQLLNF